MTDLHGMALALVQARRGLGTTAPNPAVGAVVVRGDAVLGEGYTRPIGGPHAEVVAIEAARAAGHDLAGATMYVTLEPCCHWGRTPPCTDAILAAGLGRVVVGVVDAYPPMRGNALTLLRDSGVEITLGVREAECGALVRGFTRAVTRGLPEVTAKVATSLDGRIATASGESRWITGEAARAHGHLLRAEHDAILVGIGTVLSDDPRLTCRARAGADPVPVVLDSHLRTPRDAALFWGSHRPVVLCREDAPERDLPAEIVRVGPIGEGVDLLAGLRALAGLGLHRVLVEGGGKVHRSFLDAGLVDTLCVYLAGVVLPGGVPWVGGPPLASLADAPRLGRPEVEALGDDVLLRYALAFREA